MPPRRSFIYVGRRIQASLPDNQVSLLVNEDRTVDTFTGSQGNPTPGEGKHNLNTALGGEQDLGMAGDIWTISMWLKPEFSFSDTDPDWSISIGQNRISLLVQSTTTTLETRFAKVQSNRASFAFWSRTNNPSYPLDVSGQWAHLVFAMDNQLLTLPRFWANSVELLNPFNEGTAVNPNAPFVAPNNVVLGDTNPFINAPFRGNLGHIGIWNTILTQSSINEIFNPTAGVPFELDLNVNSGGYTQAANLVQYWKPGAIADVNQFGNSFKTGGGHNLQNGSDFDGLTAWTVQIPLANRVADVPT